jgi:hypothetical protein
VSLAPGTRLGPYEILSPLGSGGMGEVHRARDTRLSREVAVNALPRDARRRVALARDWAPRPARRGGGRRARAFVPVGPQEDARRDLAGRGVATAAHVPQGQSHARPLCAGWTDDRPHNFRLDATYTTPFKLYFGLQAYAQSGPPLSSVGYFNQIYVSQTQLVPVGSAGRLPTQYEANLSIGYPVRFGPVTVTGLFYVFNLLDKQIITNVDNNWQISRGVNYPKSPGQYNQLFYPPCTAAQASDPAANKCNEQNNVNYGKATSRQAPRLLRAALKISF